MKIVFLDIDGVLNDSSFNPAAESSSLQAPLVARLNRILRATGAKVVLSSSWRYLILDRAMTIQGFEYLLRTHGLDRGCLIGHTGADEVEETGGDRARQIRRWLAGNQAVTAWVVLDDGAVDLGADSWRHVRPRREVGLTDDDATRTIAILDQDA
jgi:hypothetical protein